MLDKKNDAQLLLEMQRANITLALEKARTDAKLVLMRERLAIKLKVLATNANNTASRLATEQE